MAFWFNAVTGEVAESTTPCFPAAVRMGPYETRFAALNAFRIADARNALADAAARAQDDADDGAEREWKENW
ncbi:hypothetical protein QEV69_09330 [Trueperella pyogenes]|uniref:hypothetical protein n=1 Tax=Trueperella pyogenes TaxID=1661 RepID=UPI002169C358|nr:hypothetical protein [Trueperella pyogenes]UVJ54537.1 hypothetical protein K5713_04445 [Trueperella pyogenes]UVJ56528.1 hypothetical protein M1F27_04260 [Trueperella pyogenes]